MWDYEQVTPEESATVLAAYQHAEKVAATTKALRAAEAKASSARANQFAAIAAAKEAGVRPVDLVKLTGYSSEYIRQIIIKVKENTDA